MTMMYIQVPWISFNEAQIKPWAFFPCLPPENAPPFALYAVSLTRSLAKTERSGDLSETTKKKSNTQKKKRLNFNKTSRLKPGQTSPGWKRMAFQRTFQKGRVQQLQVTIPGGLQQQKDRGSP